MSEARTGRRFPLQLTTTIRGAKAAAKLEGKTADLSAAGVFIQADGHFEIGSPIEFDITLPAGVIGSKKDVAIRCQGRVVRASSAAAGKNSVAKKSGTKSASKKEKTRKGGIACVIDNYEFIRK